MVYKFFEKKASNTGATKFTGGAIKNKIMPNHQLAEELQKSIFKKFKKQKVFSSFKNNIWRADLADMQLISKYSKGFHFILCVIDIYSKYAWVFHLKDKKRYYKY